MRLPSRLREKTVWVALLLASCSGVLEAQQDSAPVSTADSSVRFLDGSFLNGDIVGLSLGVLKVRRPDGTDAELKWAQVASMKSDKPLDIVVRHGEKLRGPVGPAAAENSVTVLSEATGEEIVVPLRLISEINPAVGKWKLKGNISLGASLSDGNTRARSLSALGELQATRYPHRVTLDTLYSYADSDDELTAQNGKGALKYDYFIWDRLYIFNGARYEHDKLKDLQIRQIYSIGPGYQFVSPGDYPEEYFNNERWLNGMDMSGEAGLAYFIEDYYAASDRAFLAARWAVRLDWPVMPRLTVFHRDQGYPSLEDVEDLYISTQQGVRFKIYDGFFASFQVNWDWDNKPAPEAKRSDFVFLVTLSYLFDL